MLCKCLTIKPGLTRIERWSREPAADTISSVATPVIEYDNVSLTFDDQTVVRDFSLRVSPGERVLLAGASGSGKTSLLRLCLGFASPAFGRVWVEGSEVDEQTCWEIRRRIAYVPQAAGFVSGTGRAFLERVFGFRANAGRDVGVERHEAMDRLRLTDRALARPLVELSGGERQRITLLVALMLGRSVFLLDEATASLDDQFKAELVELFATEPGWTVLAASHDHQWREHDAFRVVEMEHLG
jgi:putative ABC transport system ATP-binding protein